MERMKIARIHGAANVELDELPTPAIGPNDLLVKVRACGICGSDLGYIAMGGLGGEGPMPIGHEFAGDIVAVGSNISEFSVGDAVAGNPDQRGIGNGGPEGAMATIIHIPDANPNMALHKIPPHISYEEAALAEPLSVALHGMNLVHVTNKDQVVVLGAGPIGLCAVAMLAHRGVQNIVVVDRVASRLQRALALGAHAIVNTAESDLSDSLAEHHGAGERYGKKFVGTDVFIDAAGAGALLNQIIDIAKFGARISIIALYKSAVPINLYQVMANELKISGSIADQRADEFQQALDMMAAKPINRDAMISHRFSIEDLHPALSMAADADQSAKVMILLPA